MIFDNSKIRRRDRLLDENRAIDMLKKAEYGVLSMAGSAPDGESSGYGVPLNYVLENSRIYFHCAPDGEKLRRITANPQVSFCVVGRTKVLPDKFSTGYESVIASGKAAIVTDDRERMDALRSILRKYSPEFYDTGLKYSRASFGRVAIIRMDIETVSAKSKSEGIN